VGGPLSDDARARAIALLEATHQFPVDYPVSIIAVTDDAVIAQVRAAVELGLDKAIPDDAYERVLSGAGRYSSHRFKVPCRNAEEVLALYERLRKIEGVKSIL
jgi:putative lipoic acid-binding regulatory protein